MPATTFAVELTQGAEDDLEALYDYLATNRSVTEADALLDALSDKIGTLERFPSRGAVPKELAALGIREFRQILVRPYRLIYRVVARRVIVMLIADGRRDMQTALERRMLGG